MQGRYTHSAIQALLQMTEYGVLLTQKSRNVHFANARLGSLFGFPLEVSASSRSCLPWKQLRQQMLSRVRDPTALATLLNLVPGDSFEEIVGEIALLPPELCLLQVRSVTLRDCQGSPDGRLWTFREIDATEASTETLTAIQMQAVGTLSMGVAHDLRNIVTSLRLEMAELEGTTWGMAAEAQVDRLYTLTHSLLALADETSLPSSAVDLGEIIAFVLGLFRRQALTDGVQLRLRGQRELPPIIGNARRLEQVFVILLRNALDATTGSGGTITVTLSQEGSRVRVDVRDTGQGISADQRTLLFEPFYTTRANRTGLGLYGARRIITAHQGEIQVTSRPGRGACISVWLPAITPASLEAGGVDDGIVNVQT